MPYLKKSRTVKPKQIKRIERQNIYQSKRWKLLRQYYLNLHPLCEICLARGIIKPADDVHHADSFLNYNGDKRIEVAFDKDNLVSVCRQCHNWLHRNGTTHGINIKQAAELISKESSCKK